ncbi:MAG: hypothetical protein PWP20_1195 [Eubacteriaceae bacterium]|jgi:predicted metal-binding protein|nr:hypothetical protein [Eubacteriaceae bacterium]
MKSSDMIPSVDTLMAVFKENGRDNVTAAEISLSGLKNCGGCPGLKVLAYADNLVEGGADAIVFISPLLKNKSGTYKCPHLARMVQATRSKMGDEVLVLEYHQP